MEVFGWVSSRICPMWTVDASGRLDTFLAEKGAFVSRMKATEAVRSGLVTVNGRIARKGALVLAPGDTVVVSHSSTPLSESLLSPIDLQLPILYEDDACIVIDKPAGVSVHPAPGVPKDAATILHAAAFLLKERSLPFSQSAVLVHRLDRDTTGCLLLAKNADAHALLQKQFADRSVDKRYLALVAGVPSPAAAVIDAPIARSTSDYKKMTVTNAGRDRRDARTTYRTLAVSAFGTATLLECELHTGRTHQIRVHLVSIGHPVLGDPTYHSRASTELAEHHRVQTLMLHAWKLAFRSPCSSRMTQIVAPPPHAFREAATALSLSLTPA